MTGIYNQHYQHRSKIRPSSFAFAIAVTVLLVMFLVGVGYFYYSAPELSESGGIAPMDATAATAVSERSMPDAYAIQVRNEVLGGPYAVPARATEG